MKKGIFITFIAFAAAGTYININIKTVRAQPATEPKIKKSEEIRRLRAAMIISSIESAVTALERQARHIENPPFDKTQEQLGKEKEIKKIEESEGIIKLEKALRTINKRINEKAVDIYAAAPKEFRDLNRQIKTIHDNEKVKTLMIELLKIKTQIADEVRKQQEAIDKIRTAGTEIDNKTKKEQGKMYQERDELLSLQQSIGIKRRTLPEEKFKEVEKLRLEVSQIKRAVTNDIADRLQEREKLQVGQLKNAVKRLQIILNFIKDPNKIKNVSVEEIALID